MDTNRIRALLDKRDEIDRELADMFTGNGSRERREQLCSVCNKAGHSKRTCPDRVVE